MILKARGPGKFCSSRTAGIKVGKIDNFFGKVPSGERYLNFWGPAGRKSKIKSCVFVILTGQQNVFNDYCPRALRVQKFVLQSMFGGTWILERFHELGQTH